MILWTIQTLQAWKVLESKGFLQCGAAHAKPDFLTAYRWMAGQMRRRLAWSPSDREVLPVWAWYQWQNSRGRKPDLRFKAHLPAGTDGVRLELEVRRDSVLLSDFDLWHCVLNRCYLPISAEDDAAFDRLLQTRGLGSTAFDSLPTPCRQRIEDSWVRIFSLEGNADSTNTPPGREAHPGHVMAIGPDRNPLGDALHRQMNPALPVTRSGLDR